ncbi:MAG TPA: hypothetical protein VG099_18825 [Gemmataceae bacterium]|jgi:hypothetical protein|nr:hypothetical protein [Gemmataceae bacterium]
MQYKTIVLHLLEQHPGIYDPLRRQRQVLPAMEHYARELRNLHLAWKETLTQERPDSDPSQIASEALELALKDLEERLLSGSPRDGQEALSLDQAMAFIRRHTPRG